MKKIISLLIACGLIMPGILAYSAEDVEIYIDGERLECESTPVNIDGRVLVPMRAIFEALGIEVSWDANERTVWTRRGQEFMGIGIDKDIISEGIYNSDGAAVWVDDIYLDVPAQIINDFTYVPVRAVSETLGVVVSWDGENNRVVIDSQRDMDGVVYYSSDSDYQKLYSVGKNGLDRHKISERSVYELEMYEGFVYYLDKTNNCLFRANDEAGEEAVINAPVNKVAIEDGYIYYQELDGNGKESGVLYRFNLSTWESERLTENSVKYPEKYRDFLYFNLSNDNQLCCLTLDGTQLYKIDIGDSEYATLYPFNCFFYGDYILVENGVWFGNLTRINRDGSDVQNLTQSNALIFRRQQIDDNILYLLPDNGQDIYCIGIDGSNNHLVHSGDPKWLDIQLLAQWGDTIYYKNPMRKEVYRVNLDGSGDAYVGYADDLKIFDGRMVLSYKGLYIGSLDASDLTEIYSRDVRSFDAQGDTLYFIDNASGRLYMSDFSGRVSVITADSAGEWVCD